MKLTRVPTVSIVVHPQIVPGQIGLNQFEEAFKSLRVKANPHDLALFHEIETLESLLEVATPSFWMLFSRCVEIKSGVSGVWLLCTIH